MFEIGSSLHDARVRQGLELPELEAETKIRAKYLRALEEERFDLLPGDAYAKGFLRTYADRLGLDGQLYVDEYNSRFSLADEPAAASRPRRRSRTGRLESHAVLIALAGIVAVTVLVIAAWKLGGEEEAGAPGPSVPAAESGTVPADTIPEEAVVEPPPVVLTVTAARGRSKLEVREGSASGALVWEGTLEEGKTQQVAGTRLWVFLSRAQSVELDLNGESLEGRAGRGPTALLVRPDGIEAVDAP